MADLSSTHRRSQAKCQLVQTSSFIFLVCHIINVLLVGLYGRILTSVVCTSRHCVPSVLATSVKILPYRPPSQLITANSKTFYRKIMLHHRNYKRNVRLVARMRQTELLASIIFFGFAHGYVSGGGGGGGGGGGDETLVYTQEEN